jgi:REP element-mobilizing transposase RayT
MFTHRRNLPHYEKYDYPHFLTFRTYKDLKLPPDARSLALRHCLLENDKRLRMYAAVIMPNHAHMIFTPLIDDLRERYSLSEIMNSIKGASAHSINKLMGRRGHVWQDESFDHVIRKADSLEQKIHYVCMNPVRAGLSRTPEEYQWLWKEAQPRAAVPHSAWT